jgi:hypothetical protein
MVALPTSPFTSAQFSFQRILVERKVDKVKEYKITAIVKKKDDGFVQSESMSAS